MVAATAEKKVTMNQFSLDKSKVLTDLPDSTFGFAAFRVVFVETGRNQVWSLTQFYSVDFSQSRIGVYRAFSTYAQSRFASVVVVVSWDLRALRGTPAGVLVSL